MMCKQQLFFLLGILTERLIYAFHDCIQDSRHGRQRKAKLLGLLPTEHKDDNECAGGICVGMTNGPHQGGNASYPLDWNGLEATSVSAAMTVPGLPEIIDNSITYYIWTDVFMGDGGTRGRMNQFVPQLILGSALDGSTGFPDYKPVWQKTHTTWSFAAHYFFELASEINPNQTEAHAAYGDFFPAYEGEKLWTSFRMVANHKNQTASPIWILKMGVVGDDNRTSTLTIPQPYMGMGQDWGTRSWLEPYYQRLCINSCWEMYGARNSQYLPSTGANYKLEITTPSPIAFTTWERDEGNGQCPSVDVSELHNDVEQTVSMYIHVQPQSGGAIVDQLS